MGELRDGAQNGALPDAGLVLSGEGELLEPADIGWRAGRGGAPRHLKDRFM